MKLFQKVEHLVHLTLNVFCPIDVVRNLKLLEIIIKLISHGMKFYETVNYACFSVCVYEYLTS
jgi:hypothetical protein